MNITAIASTLDWRGNNHGVWKALVKDMTPDSAVTFANGYTTTVSGRTVSVTNTTAPVGTMTYDSELTNAVNATPLYGAGTAYDMVEAVAGKKTVRMGSVDMGSLNWTRVSASDGDRFFCDLSDAKPVTTGTLANAVCDAYLVVTSGAGFSAGYFQINNASRLYVYEVLDKYATASAFKTAMSGVMLYYELTTPTTSTETPQSLSLTTGDDTLSGGSFDTVYEGTDYSIPLIRNCKYLHRSPDGTESLVTGSTTNTSIDVKGGESKLVNLTHWFGRNREPSIEDFYKLYPTWKTYDIPYDQGSVLNYKGTGVETIGFNAYDHSTGTAALLGGNKYQICGTFTSVSYVDIFGNTETITLDSANCFTPINDGTLTVTGGNGTDTLVHLVWSGYKNYGEPEYKWEPFIRNVKELPISTYFPEGMNEVPSADGTGVVSDELTSEQVIKRVGVVDAGTRSWTKVAPSSSYPYGFLYTGTERVKGMYNIRSNKYSPGTRFDTDKVIFGNNNGTEIYLVDSDLSDLTDTELATALTGCLIYYELSTPVVTQIDQPLNLAYPVNDFGTEHSLPQNTTTLVTTDLKALIKYNTDYMRMNSQLSGIFPTVKSLAQQEQDGYIMKKDDTAPNAIVGGAYNLIDRNAEGTERQFSFDTSGGTQDITDGTAVAKKSMGTTLNLNQLVHDTNQNTVTGNGQVEVEDAVAGDVTSLVVEGRSLVRNQLVPPSLEETEDSANGVIEVSDAVAGDAKSLVMTAPRSVVVNQYISNTSTFSTGSGIVTSSTRGSNYSFIIEWNNNTDNLVFTSIAIGELNKHIVLCKSSVLNNTGDALYKLYINRTTQQPSVLNTSLKLEINDYGGSSLVCGLSPNTSGSITFTVQLVDLTQYFNGDTTLINSINSWDDLVAYDPRFASYVEYNTGTVSGVQPSVQVTGKNLFDKNASGVAQGYIYNVNGAVTSSDNYSHTDYIPVKGGSQITGSYPSGAGSNPSIAFYTADKTFISGIKHNGDAQTAITYVCPPNCAYVRDSFKNGDIDSYQLELGSTSTSYEPYHDGGTAQAPAPLFAVGSAADEFEAVAGVTTRKMASVDLGTLNWNTSWFNREGDGRLYANVAGKAFGLYNLITSYGITVTGNDNDLRGAVGVCGNPINSYVYIGSGLRYSTAQDFIASLQGVLLYYELATPTTSASTPTQISLQAGSNVAMQTDGGRTAPFSLTYDGTEFTLPLDSTHKYAFSDNGTKSIVTNATEQAVTGGQDMLVDVTRMFNGDATAINAITSWADMAAVMPEYLSNVAYNEGEVVGRSGGVTTAVWNQLVQNGNFADGAEGWRANAPLVTVSVTNGSIKIEYPGTGKYGIQHNLTSAIPADHICLLYFKNVDPTHVGNKVFQSMLLGESSSSLLVASKKVTLTDTVADIVVILQPTFISTRLSIRTERDNTEAGDYFTIGSVQLFDLTEIYGAGHEPSTFEEFEADCAKWGKDLTQYQPYDAGTPMGGSATFSDLHGVGDVKETLDVITGEKQVKYGEVDLGTLTWVYSNSRFFATLTDAKVYNQDTPCICSRYSYNSIRVNNSVMLSCGSQVSGVMSVCITDSTYTSASNFKSAMQGVLLYYEKKEPTTSSETPQPLTFIAGLNDIYEENMDITGTPVTMEYTGTDYEIAAKTSRVYLKDVDGTVERVTGVSSFSVRGGRDNVMDLTRMFGVGLEPGTLADLYALFPTWNGYRLPYNKGSLLNFKGTGLKSVGFNQFNGEYSETGKYMKTNGNVYTNSNWNVSAYLRVIPGQTYRLTCYGRDPSICWYTYDKALISGMNYNHQDIWQEDAFTAPTNAYWCRFSVYMPKEQEICFYFQWSGTRNGDYEPYWDYVRPIPTLTYFPEGMHGRGNVYDEINPRQAVRRFGKVDLGTLNWTASGNGEWTTTLSGMKSSSPVIIPSEGYDISTSGTTLTVTSDSEPVGDMVYELATPVVTTFPEEISATARISDYGTEECLPVNGYDPVTAPFRGMVLYQEDYARTITKLPENYISKESMEAFIALVGPLLDGTVGMTYNQSTGQYAFNFTPNA